MDTFHYTGIIQELTEGLRHVLQASDWKEGVGVAAPLTDAQRRAQDFGNVTAALSRVRNAFQALDQRRQTLETDVRLAEQPMMQEAAKLAEAIAQGELPSPLRHAHPEVSDSGE